MMIYFALAPMVALAPGSTYARPSAQPPIDTSGNLSAQVSEGGGIEKNLKNYGGKGGPTFFYRNLFSFLRDLKSDTKFRNPTITPSGRKLTQAERERERERKKEKRH